jgi:hypothetical protein
MSLRAVTFGFVLAIGLSGCAMTVRDTKVDYVFSKSPPIDLTASAATIRVADFRDSRDNPNPRMIMNMQNMNGQMTSGGWQAEKPVAAIVRDRVIQGLVAAHSHVVGDSESLVL